MLPQEKFHQRNSRVPTLTQQSTNSTSIARSAGIVSIAVMCSRVLGLIREQAFAIMFGAGLAYDAFVVAFRIPNLLRDLFGEGALSAAFVTIFSDYNTQRSREETWLLASNVLCFFAVALSCITLLGIALSYPIVDLLASDFREVQGKTELTVTLTRIMLPFLVVISLSAVVMGMLNTKGRFFIPALASSFFNLGSIIGGVSLTFVMRDYGYPPIIGMAIGTLIGGILQLAIQLPSLKATGFRFIPRISISDPGLRRILKLMIPATIGLSATQINIFINTNFASSCVQGSVSWLNYAFRLVQLPIGMFGVALSIAMLPLLAKQASNKNISEMRATLISSLVMVLALTIPATAGLILLDEEIIRLIFEHGVFSATDTVATAQALSLYAVGLFAYSSNKVLVPAFYALDKPKYPVIASFIAIGTNLIFVQLTIDKFQHLAIAMSVSVTMLLNFIFLFSILYFKMEKLPLGYLFTSILKITAATFSLVAVLMVLRTLFESFFTGSISTQAIALAVTISVAAGIYMGLLHLLRLQELTAIIVKVQSRLFAR